MTHTFCTDRLITHCNIKYYIVCLLFLTPSIVVSFINSLPLSINPPLHYLHIIQNIEQIVAKSMFQGNNCTHSTM
ncbi:hypothetical protein BRADI_3g30763v3 [Brachypodium distachyon]|uniref:Uncharacterized protein n=1 Tax=Brachypodium distachyon TaxID=15368 RepID=A0A2K2D0A4_BRADI|nr:hypothetical protein BRADI_3g30763v3 [Brachypodium distachyon]